jgi:hypothetical protein
LIDGASRCTRAGLESVVAERIRAEAAPRSVYLGSGEGRAGCQIKRAATILALSRVA